MSKFYGRPFFQFANFAAAESLQNFAFSPSVWHAKKKPWRLGERDNGYSDFFNGQNKREWSDWLGAGSQAGEFWYTVLTQYGLPRLDSAIFFLEGKGGPPRGWNDFAVLKGVPKEKLLASLWYAGFAARVEPLSRRRPPEDWDAKPQRGHSVATDTGRLFRNGLAQARKQTFPFVRQRYFFQLAKLLFYTRPDSALQFLETCEAEFKGPSQSLYWRVRMYRAGLLRKSDPVGANLELARVWNGFPPLREMAVNDFGIREQSEWVQTLAGARGKEEKIALWFLFGMNTMDISAIRQILALDSASSYPALLAANQLAHWEAFERQSGSYSPDTDSLRLLAVQAARSRRTSCPAFWNLFAGYLQGSAGKGKDALALLDSSQKLSTEVPMREQIRLVRILARLRSAKEPSGELEDFLMTENPVPPRCSTVDRRLNPISSDGYGPNRDFMNRFAGPEGERIWRRSPGMSLAFANRVSNDLDTLRMQVDFSEGVGTRFEQYLKSWQEASDSVLRAKLGVGYLYTNRFGEAVNMLQRHPPQGRFPSDPFHSEILDFQGKMQGDQEEGNRELANAGHSTATLLAYARELDRLEKKSRRPGTEGAKAALRLGIGLYNRTSFGTASSMIFEMDWYDLCGNRATAWRWDLQAAQRQFERALVELSTTEERAWATWLLAKCERDSLVGPSAWRWQRKGKMSFDSLPIPVHSYQSLKAQYSQTKFWKSALAECGWLAKWNAKN